MSRPRRTCAALVVALAVLAFVPAGFAAGEMNLYDWMGVADLVVHGAVVDTSGRFTRVDLLETIRGDAPATPAILVDVHRVNAKRPRFSEPIRLEPDTEYLFLLMPSRKKKKTDVPLYDLERGVRGAREVPAETGSLMLGAARTLGRTQAAKDERQTWVMMGRYLEDTNPILVETALDHHLKFRRGSIELLPLLRPLLEHPRPELRTGAIRLIDQALERQPPRDAPESSLLHAELAARARRDNDADVRLAATEALSRLWAPGARELLESIADDDADQNVRLAASRLLHEKSLEKGENTPAVGGR